jgi:hypothetical protein
LRRNDSIQIGELSGLQRDQLVVSLNACRAPGIRGGSISVRVVSRFLTARLDPQRITAGSTKRHLNIELLNDQQVPSPRERGRAPLNQPKVQKILDNTHC